MKNNEASFLMELFMCFCLGILTMFSILNEVRYQEMKANLWQLQNITNELVAPPRPRPKPDPPDLR